MKINIEDRNLMEKGIQTYEWWEAENTDFEEIKKYFKNLRASNGLNPEELNLYIESYEDDILEIADKEDLEEIFNKYNELKDLRDDEKLAISAIMKNGEDFYFALEKVKNGNYDLIDLRKNLHPLGDNEVALADYLIERGDVEVPEDLKIYIDYKKLGRDKAMDYFEVEDGLFINY